MTAQEQYSAGLRDGEAWARATGTTSADIHMVPVVKGTRDYKAGHRVGVAKVRNERSLAEQGVEHDDLFEQWDAYWQGEIVDERKPQS